MPLTVKGRHPLSEPTWEKQKVAAEALLRERGISRPKVWAVDLDRIAYVAGRVARTALLDEDGLKVVRTVPGWPLDPLSDL